MLRRRCLSAAASSSSSSSSYLLHRFHKSSVPPPPPSDIPLRSSPSRLLSTSTAAAAVVGAQAGGGGGVKKTPFARRLVHVVLLSLTGGVALSALNDLAIFHGCSSKAIEKASQNQEVIDSLGEPIVRGPWYDASLAVGHRRHTVSCKFPVSGPKGNAIMKIKAVRTGDNTWFSFLRHNDWDILISEALVQNDHNQSPRVILIDNVAPSEVKYKHTTSTEHGDQEKKERDWTRPRLGASKLRQGLDIYVLLVD